MIRVGRSVLIVAVILVVLGGVLFLRQVWIYYDAIKSGKTNPILERRMESSWSKLVANNQVGPQDIARLTAAETASLGTKGAKLRIVEFIDFDCPYTKASFAPVREMIQKYKDQVYFVVRDFPIEEIHPRALPAALAARCAAAQGKFWPYHDKLYMNQDKHEDTDLQRYADEVGLNGPGFSACYRARVHNSAVQQDVQDGLRVGVEGTPTFFFNDVRIQGKLDVSTLEYLIQKFLKEGSSK